MKTGLLTISKVYHSRRCDVTGAGLSGRGVRRRHPMVAGSVKNAVGNYLYWMRLGREMPVYPKLPKRIKPVDPFHRK